MSKYKIEPSFPLGGAAPQLDEYNGLTIRENTDIAFVSLSARSMAAEETAMIAERVLGCTLPAPGGRAEGKSYAVFWTAPGQWFVEAKRQADKNLIQPFIEEFGDSASLTDQSDGWVVFDINGINVLPMLERLCQLDIIAANRGFAARTVIDHLGVFVICLDKHTWRIMGARSSAGSLHHSLYNAAVSVT